MFLSKTIKKFYGNKNKYIFFFCSYFDIDVLVDCFVINVPGNDVTDNEQNVVVNEEVDNGDDDSVDG